MMPPANFTFPFFILLNFLLHFITVGEGATVKGMFVFGSSIVDNGNNNYVRNSTARADYLPYGIDFLDGPSGRFSNGNNPVDVLGKLLNLPHFLPVFCDPRTRGKRIMHGVNYASGGSGILDETGSVSGRVITLKQQIENFGKTTLPELEAQLGSSRKLSRFLSKTLFVIGTGGNDYLLNYFHRNLSSQYSLATFTSLLVDSLSLKLKKLYDLGARKFVLMSVQAIGCVPAVTMRFNNDGECVEPINLAAVLFNTRLMSSMKDMKTKMPGSNLVFVNSYTIIRGIIDSPTSHAKMKRYAMARFWIEVNGVSYVLAASTEAYIGHSLGFKVANKACCTVGLASAGILCERGGSTCVERDAYVFYDGLHPTDAVNGRIAHKAYASTLKREVYPFNVKHLASL